jgi:hypothetical protein
MSLDSSIDAYFAPFFRMLSKAEIYTPKYDYSIYLDNSVNRIRHYLDLNIDDPNSVKFVEQFYRQYPTLDRNHLYIVEFMCDIATDDGLSTDVALPLAYDAYIKWSTSDATDFKHD